jgi:2'-5' RNA ligase
MKRSFLDNHYDSILTANRKKILAGGNGDAFLGNALTDNRMALVVLIRIPSDAAEKINRCIDDLKGIEPNLYYYPAEDFHITVMDVLKGEEGRRIPPNINEYIRCIEECSKDISPFKVKFDGLTASDNAIMVRGYYDDQLMVFRQNLRDMLKQRGLSLEERYKTISSHITIARLHSKFQNPEKLLDFIEKSRSFGTMTVRKMEISFHNWYDTKKEVLSILEL